LDKRLDEERKRNEISYKKQGITGTSIVTEGNEPTFDLNDFINIFEIIHSYMEEHPEEFPAPADNLLIRKTPDPRINQNLYAEEKKGIIEGFENENLIAMELKKLDGNYTIIILGKDSADGEWGVLSEGDVYKLREEITNGN